MIKSKHIFMAIGIAASTSEMMVKTFKWFEKKHGRKHDYSRPIIKGV